MCEVIRCECLQDGAVVLESEGNVGVFCITGVVESLVSNLVDGDDRR